MANFREIKIEDKKWVDGILNSSYAESLEYNFTTAFIWRKIYGIQISPLCNGELYTTKTKDNSFLIPQGNGNIKGAIDEIFDYCKENKILPRFYSVTENTKKILEEYYPNMFRFRENRDGADYVYESEKLATLSGKKLSAKRNHINRFIENNPDWKYEKIDKSNISEAFEMNEKWCRAVNFETKKGLKEEGCAVREAFENFDELKLVGGLIRAQGEVVAYSMGDPLNKDTFLVHIEKAFAEVQGAYAIMNREFVSHNCKDYIYVNREDDTGDEGLRKAKLSYKPVKLIDKWIAKAEYI